MLCSAILCNLLCCSYHFLHFLQIFVLLNQFWEQFHNKRYSWYKYFALICQSIWKESFVFSDSVQSQCLNVREGHHCQSSFWPLGELYRKGRSHSIIPHRVGAWSSTMHDALIERSIRYDEIIPITFRSVLKNWRSVKRWKTEKVTRGSKRVLGFGPRKTLVVFSK